MVKARGANCGEEGSTGARVRTHLTTRAAYNVRYLVS
jgi:hypothetical protein